MDVEGAEARKRLFEDSEVDGWGQARRVEGIWPAYGSVLSIMLETALIFETWLKSNGMLRLEGAYPEANAFPPIARR